MTTEAPRAIVPVLEGWVSLPVAARRLDVKRQRLFQMGTEEDKLRSLHQIPGAGERPAAYVVSEAELCQLRRTQLAAAIKAASADETEEGAEEVRALTAMLDAVQFDAARMLLIQLGAAADAADAAGDGELAGLLRTRAESMQAPVAA